MSRLEFDAIGKPEPQGSARAFVRGGRPIVTTDNPKMHQWRDIMARAARDAMATAPWIATDGPVLIEAEFRMLRPASVSVKRRPSPTVKPDLDKLARSLLDALTAVAFADDAQVTEITARKRYTRDGEHPGVHVLVLTAQEGARNDVSGVAVPSAVTERDGG